MSKISSPFASLFATLPALNFVGYFALKIMFGISPWQPDMAAFQASNLWENAAKIVTQVRDKVSKFFNKTHKNSRKARQKAVLQLV